jgi:hypothetical protein
MLPDPPDPQQQQQQHMFYWDTRTESPFADYKPSGSLDRLPPSQHVDDIAGGGAMNPVHGECPATSF